MQDFDAPFSKVDVFTAAQHLRRCSLKKRIVVYIITVRQLAALGHIASDDLQRLRKTAVKPSQLRFVRIKIGGNIGVRRYDPNERVWRRP